MNKKSEEMQEAEERLKNTMMDIVFWVLGIITGVVVGTLLLTAYPLQI